MRDAYTGLSSDKLAVRIDTLPSATRHLPSQAPLTSPPLHNHPAARIRRG